MLLFKKKNKSEQYQVMLNKMKGIVELKEIGLVKTELNSNSIFLYPELWQSFDTRKKTNWCKNFYLYANLFSREYPKYKSEKPLHFFNINDEKLMATYYNEKLTLFS